MRNSYCIRSIGVLLFMSVILLAACAQEVTRVESPQGVVVEIASPQSTTTLTPTLSPEATREVLLPTVEPLTPTAAATTTLTPQQVLDDVRRLFDENAGCALPCWWGIEPGKTTWEAALTILSPLAQEIFPPWPLRDSTPSSAPQVAYDVLIPVPRDIFPARLEHRYVVQEGVVQKIEVTVGHVDSYLLSEMLDDLGQPQEVWISTYSMEREGSLPYTIVLYYPDQAVLIRFAGEAEVEGDFVVACPQDYSVLALVLWSVNKSYPSFEVAVNDTIKLGPFYHWDYQRLEDVTDMDRSAFFETFKVAGNTTCIKSEAKHWPSP